MDEHDEDQIPPDTAAWRDEMNRIGAMMKQRDENTEKCKAEVLEVLRRYWHDTVDEATSLSEIRSALKAEDVLAEAIRLFAVGGITELYLEWTAAAYLTRDVKERLATAEKVHYRLFSKEYTRDNPYRFNDLDNRAFYVPLANEDEDTSRIAFCLEDQNLRFLYIISESRVSKRFRCVQYWDRLDREHASFDLDGESDKVAFALRYARWISEYYSDCTAEKPDGQRYHPDRPDLNWFLRQQDSIGYGDGRDPHHVFSVEMGDLMSGLLDTAMMHRAQMVGMALFNLDNCWDDLGGGEADA